MSCLCICLVVAKNKICCCILVIEKFIVELLQYEVVVNGNDEGRIVVRRTTYWFISSPKGWKEMVFPKNLPVSSEVITHWLRCQYKKW